MLERFAETSKAVFQDAIRALALPDLSLAQDAYERGEQSIKVYRLLMRLALQAAKSKNIREQMKLHDISSVIIKIIAIRELGRMAYYSMRIAQHVAEIDKKLDDQIVPIIQKADQDHCRDAGPVSVCVNEKGSGHSELSGRQNGPSEKTLRSGLPANRKA